MTVSSEGGAPAAAEGAAALLEAPPAAAPAGGESGQGGGNWWAALGVSADKPDTDQLSDAEWLANKNFADMGTLIKSARSLETKLNSDGRVALPKDANDKDGWEALAKALGRPDTPDGYQLEMPGVDAADPILKGFREQAHALGLAPHAVQELAKWFGGAVDGQAQLSADKAKGELQQAWGGEYDANIEHGRRAMEKLGITPADVNAMAAGYGLSASMQLLAKIGRGIGEGGGLPGSGAGGGQTLEQLQARKAEIMRDPEQQQKLLAGDTALKAEWERIIEAEAKALEAQYGRRG